MRPAYRGPVLFARYIALAWCALIIYGSLHPFSGWRDTGLSPWAFLDGGLPRYWTGFDLAANVAVYLPLGYFLTLAIAAGLGRYGGMVVAILLSALLSAGLEAVQTWLPSRVPSNLDLACNSLGGLLGAILARLTGAGLVDRAARWQQRLMAPVPHAELGLTLLALWLLVSLTPETLLFGAGDLRQLLGLGGALPFEPAAFPPLEASITACHAVAVGLLARHLIARTRIAYFVVPAFLGLALCLRTLSAVLLVNVQAAFVWLTPGALWALLVALGVLGLTLWLPAALRLMLAALALMAATVLVNLAPPNPYSLAALTAWKQGHFLNFNGLTRWVAILWPFLTLPYLLLISRRP